MQNIDVDGFSRLITETAECYSQKPPTPGAQRRWFELLRDHPFERVHGAMRAYMRTRQRMPTPADILGIAQSMTPAADVPAPVVEDGPHHVTDHARQCSATLRQFLNRDPVRPSRQWATDILSARAEGVPLVYYDPLTGAPHPVTGEKIADWQARFAQRAVDQYAGRFLSPASAPAIRERVPGEDDE